MPLLCFGSFKQDLPGEILNHNMKSIDCLLKAKLFLLCLVLTFAFFETPDTNLILLYFLIA